MMNVCLALLFTDVLALPSQAAQQATSAEFQKLINGDEGVDASPKTGPEVEVTEPAVEEVTEPDIEVTEPQVEITEPEVGIIEPEVEVTEPQVEITEPEVGIIEPEVEPAPEEKVEPAPEEKVEPAPEEEVDPAPEEEVEPAPVVDPTEVAEAGAGKEGISCGGHDEEVCGKCLEAAEEAKVDDKASYCNGDCQLTLGEAAEDDVCSANGTAKFVDCGEHQAGDCAACANTARKHYCNGVCKWSDEENVCELA